MMLCPAAISMVVSRHAIIEPALRAYADALHAVRLPLGPCYSADSVGDAFESLLYPEAF
jgi:hypothetical protein